jgi:hypothetical protein
MADAEQVRDAAEVYVYGYPLVYDLKEVASFVEGGGSLPMQAPCNHFGSARRLLGPETRFVSPNNDTLYVGGQCDVRQGPLVLHVQARSCGAVRNRGKPFHVKRSGG